MSVDLNVYLPRSSMPTPDQWATAITDAGFDAQLDREFDVDTFTGFLPCTYKSEVAGFEYYADRLTEQDRASLELAEQFDFAITFATGSNMRELITSMIAAGVLCQLAGGIFFDPQSGEFTRADSVMDLVRSEVAECEKHI